MGRGLPTGSAGLEISDVRRIRLSASGQTACEYLKTADVLDEDWLLQPAGASEESQVPVDFRR